MRNLSRLHVVPFLALAVVLAALVAGCGGSGDKQSVPDGSVAVVGGRSISAQQLDTLLAQARRGYKTQKKAFPKTGTAAYRTLRDQAVAFLVQVSELEQRAQKLGVHVTQKQVDDYVTQVKQQSFGGNEKSYKAGLAQRGLTEADFLRQTRLQLVEQGLFKKITAKVKVSDAALRTYYDAHKAQFGQPDTRTVRHILVSTKPLATRIYAQLEGGADFAALAKKYSRDPGSAKVGGKLTVSKGQTVPEFDKVAFSLAKGELSKPVKSQYGWHIIQALTPVQRGVASPFASVKESIRTQLVQAKQNAAATKWIDRTTRDYCDGKIAYGDGFAPKKDPCAKAKAKAKGATTSTTTGSTTG
jgi:parvulin-like peptidyl-prolyl isomerase